MKITIPKPCHENWNAMSPDEKGRFCSVCSKTVRDFRRADDDEIIDVFSRTSEEICGNFNPSQLNRDLNYSYINSLLMKFAVGVMLTTGGIVSVNAQECATKSNVINLQNGMPMGKVISSPPVLQNADHFQTLRIGGAPSSGAAYKPLYVVNGKICEYEKVKELDPNLIKTMNILKGASASVKYGEKAKDGVVVITTKKKRR
ncbi:TonB-dependent receptor plug domain-containing protein [Chryseobacterium viscerum]|uniref:TonB-dependent receptor plug domain-containing protein n=1 Tax=Chryseobacterium viscerum TaxID=1037377 RepID=UPI00222245B1|nr:TonB-dependent receptor plug domain-containing protein [Chryseobacterium viscerum]MCW1961582.1 TonB-dependent receptor plug domain-containing protein [Chryseobacterium viscerum]